MIRWQRTVFSPTNSTLKIFVVRDAKGTVSCAQQRPRETTRAFGLELKLFASVSDYI